MVHRRKYTYLLVAFLSLLLGCPTLLHASTYNYGEQGQNFGGANSDVLNPPRFAGPHALLSVDDEEHFYNRNGDLVRVEAEDSLENTQNTYTVSRKLKEVNQGGAVTRFFITATGEKVATVHPDGRKETTPSGHLQFTNNRPRYQYGGDIRTSDTGSNLWVSIQDQVGSIVATVDATMPLEKVDRHPFGGIAYHTRVDMGAGYNDRGFHGYEEEGPYTYFPARHLNKKHGRFIQADSVIPKVDTVGFNRYAYVSNNPVNRIDPSGHADLLSAAGEFVGKNGTQYQSFLNSFPYKGELGFSAYVVAPQNGSKYALDAVDDFYFRTPWQSSELAAKASGRIVNQGRTLIFHWEDWNPHRRNGVYRAVHELSVRSLQNVDEIVMERSGFGNADAIKEGGMRNLPKDKILRRDMGWRFSYNPDGQPRWVRPGFGARTRTFMRDSGQLARNLWGSARLYMSPAHLRAAGAATMSYYGVQASGALAAIGGGSVLAAGGGFLLGTGVLLYGAGQSMVGGTGPSDLITYSGQGTSSLGFSTTAVQTTGVGLEGFSSGLATPIPGASDRIVPSRNP